MNKTINCWSNQFERTKHNLYTVTRQKFYKDNNISVDNESKETFITNLNENKEHLTCCTFAQEVGSEKLSYLTLQSYCVGSVGDVLENKRKNKI